MDIPTIDDFKRLEGKVDKVMAKLGISPVVLTIKDLAARYQCSYNHIKYAAPYLMPNNGKSDFDGGTIKWFLSTVENWENVPLEERKTAWEAEQRNRALITRK